MSYIKQYLLTLELRYSTAPNSPYPKTSTIGIFNSFQDACISGNSILTQLETKYPLHQFPKGNYADKDRLSENGGPFGDKKNLVTNLAYLKTPFEFYLKITTLAYIPLVDLIESADKARREYIDWYKQQED